MTLTLPLRLVFAVALTLSLVSCGAPTPRTQSPVSTPVTGAQVSPLIPTIGIVPTPTDSNKATITGVLLRNASTPVVGAILYLANLVPDASGKPYLASIDKAASPHTQTDGAGRFVFVDVPAGTYSLVLDKVTSSYLLKDPTTGGDLLFEAKPGQVLDAGQLVFPVLPDDNPTP